MTAPQAQGKLYLMPNTLDFGVSADPPPADLQTVLPLQVIQIAARLTHWVAENAKTTRAFLKRVDAVVPLIQALQTLSIVELPRPQKGSKLAVSSPLDALLAPALQGSDIGLISEAGLPAVADPGAALVEAAHRMGVTVIPLSGPSSLMMALSASGLNGQSFAFVGYLPVDTAERTVKLRDLEALSRRQQQTQLMIETPYRNQALLAAMLTSLGANCRLSVSCGLTLQGGWTRTDSVAVWKQRPVNLPNDVPAVFALLGS
jgi:16S rRNA (cytidine1402-2'-O)-methyltransferase